MTVAGCTAGQLQKFCHEAGYWASGRDEHDAWLYNVSDPAGWTPYVECFIIPPETYKACHLYCCYCPTPSPPCTLCRVSCIVCRLS